MPDEAFNQDLGEALNRLKEGLPLGDSNNLEHTRVLGEALVGQTVLGVGPTEGGQLCLEFPNHVFVFSGSFILASSEVIKARPGLN